jgi:hypothetical protein
MPYVQRDGAGKVAGVFANPQPGYAEEFLPSDNPEVVAFLNPPPKTPDELAALFVDRTDDISRMLFEITFNHENRIRTLQGQGALTRAQYKTALINFYKSLP